MSEPIETVAAWNINSGDDEAKDVVAFTIDQSTFWGIDSDGVITQHDLITNNEKFFASLDSNDGFVLKMFCGNDYVYVLREEPHFSDRVYMTRLGRGTGVFMGKARIGHAKNSIIEIDFVKATQTFYALEMN